MLGNNNIKWSAMSNAAIAREIGAFIKHKRLEQNKTQSQLAEEAGINRTTLSLIENGTGISLMTFIQLLRNLNLLHMLQEFQFKPQISPLQLAKIEKSQRIRARRPVIKPSKTKPKR
jgi:transcriptional regulator with XRE-family HTH domain